MREKEPRHAHHLHGDPTRRLQIDERRVELRLESTENDQKVEVDVKSHAFEICGVAVGALLGDGSNGPEDMPWGA